MFDLSGRVALVTGAHRGLGYAMARALATAGADLVIAARNTKDLETAARRIREHAGVSIEVITADLSRPGSGETLLIAAEKLSGHVDILLHNAGLSTPERIDELTDLTWDDTIAVNLTAGMELTRAVAPRMRARGWGRIIYTSSTFAEVSAPNRASYSASKSGIRGLMRAAAIDLGGDGITVNCIAPGPFLTEMTDRNVTGDARQQYADATALGRWGNPDELAGPIVLLASEAGSFITGTTIFVDGGYTAR
jgi:gluconate 5-dehydrogenase